MPPSRDTLEKLLNRRDLSELESEDLLLQLTDPTGSLRGAEHQVVILRPIESFTNAIDGFEQQKKRINAKIGELRAMLTGASTDGATPRPTKGRRKTVPGAT